VCVAGHEAVAKGVAEVADWGQIRVNVNWACGAPAGKTGSRGIAHDPETVARTIQSNLVGAFLVAGQCSAAMMSGAPGPDGLRGVIVNTASVAAYEGQIGQVAYATSKGGVAAMTLPMARDLADKGVRVVAIAPGLFLTPMLQGLPEDVQASLGAQVPFPPRLGDPSEFAQLVTHIVDNPLLNGEVIRLDGALRMTAR